MNLEEKLSWIQLARMDKAGSRAKALTLIAEYGSASSVVKAQLFGEQIISKEAAAKELKDTQSFEGQILTFADADYPAALRNISNPPLVITIRGNKDLLNHSAIAIVGARNASTHGAQFAKKIAVDLARAGLVVVSGLARGIDRAAHEGALSIGADKTIAVIAGGIDNIYPHENRDIYHKIFAQGVIISENAFGAPPKSMHFPARNRIISALALGVIVIEAGLRSGTLITANYAAEQGKEVFAVPGFPADPRHHGTNQLIKQGAKLVEGAEDVLTELANISIQIPKDSTAINKPASERFVVQDLFEEASNIAVGVSAEGGKLHDQILTKLSFTPIESESLIKDLGISARAFNIALAELELADQIEVNYGKVARKKI